MIRYENATREVQFGRYTQKLQTQFVLQSMPTWLTSIGSVDYINNGIEIATTEAIKLQSCLFDVNKMVQVSAEFFNINFNSDNTEASIKLVNEAETQEIGIYSDPTNAKNYFKVIKDGTSLLQDENLGYIGTLRKFRFMCFTDAAGSSRHGSAPRNLRLSIFPTEKEITVLENGVTSYTLNLYIHPDGFDPSTIDFSGRWKFVVEHQSTLNLSGVEILIQQNC